MGQQTAALAAGGYPVTGNTEEFNGSAWTEVNNLNTPENDLAQGGTATSAIAAGGSAIHPFYAVQNLGMELHGQKWQIMNTSRNQLGGAGTDNTSSLCIGGNTPGSTANVEQWNGSSWTEVNDLNNARYAISCCRNNSISFSNGWRT